MPPTAGQAKRLNFVTSIRSDGPALEGRSTGAWGTRAPEGVAVARAGALACGCAPELPPARRAKKKTIAAITMRPAPSFMLICEFRHFPPPLTLAPRRRRLSFGTLPAGAFPGPRPLALVGSQRHGRRNSPDRWPQRARPFPAPALAPVRGRPGLGAQPASAPARDGGLEEEPVLRARRSAALPRPQR